MAAFRGRGVPIVAVVVDLPVTNPELARDAGLEFPILSDPRLRAIDAYGLRHAGAGPVGHDIAHSASVLIDGAGIVRWTFVTDNVRVRPLPDAILSEIDVLSRG